MVVELGRWLRDVVQQTVLTEDSNAVKSIGGPLVEVLEKLRLLNEFLPEDRHPLHMGAVFLFVFILALAGIPGIKESLLEEFGVKVISYDLPGFGESDPHTTRNLNSSALDMLQLADFVDFKGKFWVLGYMSGSLHAWAALKCPR